MTTAPDINSPARSQSFGVKAADQVASWILPLYFVVTLIPMSVTIASLRLTPLRVMLLILFVPFVVRLLSGAAGRIKATDILIIAHAAWITLALMVVHGPQKIPFAGITMVELVGGFFMGRILIRNANDYRRMIWLLVGAMAFLLPFALIELFTGKMIIPQIIDTVFESHSRGISATGRMGLERVYAVFEHPILFGMFCSLVIANLVNLSKDGGFLRWAALIMAIFLTFTSLSSAPLLACGLQGIMLAWDKITRGAWKTFVTLGVIGYVGVDMLSNRTPITILIETMTFDAATGWTRIAIFDYGIENAKAHPIFGIGFNDWERPDWLTGSVDNFWLLNTMRFGFVGAGFIVFAFAFHLLAIVRAPIVNPDVRRLRVGYTIALCATCFTMLTVHVWGAVGVFVMFYLGAGGWLYNSDDIDRASDSPPPSQDPTPANRFTRFSRDAQAQGFTRVPTGDATAPAAQNTYARPAEKDRRP